MEGRRAAAPAGVPLALLRRGHRLPLRVGEPGRRVRDAGGRRLGGRGVTTAVAAALVENTVLWPAVYVVQRYHPDVRAGRWPKPFADPGSIGVSFAGHAIFGALLGAFLDPLRLRRP